MNTPLTMPWHLNKNLFSEDWGVSRIVIGNRTSNTLILLEKDSEVCDAERLVLPSRPRAPGLLGVGILDGVGGVRLSEGAMYSVCPTACFRMDLPARTFEQVSPDGGEFRDVHQLDLLAGEPCCVTTGNNRVDNTVDLSEMWSADWTTCDFDTSHVNGMRFSEDGDLLLTMFGKRDTVAGWKNNPQDGRLFWANDPDTFLSVHMPHSPVIGATRLYVVETGTGQVVSCKHDFTDKKVEVTDLPGFARGLALVGDVLVIGTSMVRDSVGSNTFTSPPESSLFAGLTFFNLRTGDRRDTVVPPSILTNITDLDAE